MTWRRGVTCAGLGAAGAAGAVVLGAWSVNRLARTRFHRALHDGSYWRDRLGDRRDVRITAARDPGLLLLGSAHRHGYDLGDVEWDGTDLRFTVRSPAGG